MKIDIHAHTKKTKQGDSIDRDISVDKFAEIIKTTDVKILAITNHNHFDYAQYIEFKTSVEEVCQVWPGVEFDVLEEERRAHLIVIVSPNESFVFDQKITELVGAESADAFTISIDKIVETFDDLKAIYVVHYLSKKPNLNDNDVDKLLKLTSNPKKVLKEATNSISAGIYISHGHNSIYGSDVQDWKEYINISKKLPELRLPVESFEQFCLLLDKDDATIKTILDKKTKETIQINPFGAAELMDIDIYNDINIIFGSKGTGKTEILKAISKHYNEIGYKTEVYESNSKKLEDVYDLKGSLDIIDIEKFGVDKCTKELATLRNSTEKNITNISLYLRYYSAEATNAASQKIKINQFTTLDANSSKRNFDAILISLEHFRDFKSYFSADELLIKTIGSDLLQELDSVITKILDKMCAESEKRLIDFKSISLFNKLIQIFVSEISKKTGQPEKPIKTGFQEYASNRISIGRDAKKILDNIVTLVKPIFADVGDLGEKGRLYCQTNIIIQNGEFTDVKYSPIKKVNKTPQKIISSKIKTITEHIYSNKLFEKIAELKEIEGGENVTSINDLLLFYRHFTLNKQICYSRVINGFATQ